MKTFFFCLLTVLILHKIYVWSGRKKRSRKSDGIFLLLASTGTIKKYCRITSIYVLQSALDWNSTGILDCGVIYVRKYVVFPC